MSSNRLGSRLVRESTQSETTLRGPVLAGVPAGRYVLHKSIGAISFVEASESSGVSVKKQTWLRGENPRRPNDGVPIEGLAKVLKLA